MNKAIRYIALQLGPDRLKATTTQFQPSPNASAAEMENLLSGAIYYCLFAQKNHNGETLADRWEAEGWAGLNNDERVMTQYRRQSLPTIIEIQKVLDGQQIECVDVLEEIAKPFVLYDRTVAARAIRFDRFLSWLTHYPHFSRVGGGGVLIPELSYREFMEEIERQAKKGKQTIKQYLAEHYAECEDMMRQLSEAKTQTILRSMDAHECTAIYAIKGSRQEVEKILRSREDFEVDDRAPASGAPATTLRFVWLRRGESKELEKLMPAALQHGDESQGVGMVGTVELDADRLVVQTLTKLAFEFAKKKLPKYFGDRLVFQSESIRDFAVQEANRWPDVPLGEAPEERAEELPSALPPDVERGMVEEFYRRSYGKFPDEPIPALDGLTPRQAAKKLQMKPRLRNLMKDHLRQIERINREKGANIDINWLLDELGLSEFK